MTDKRQNYIVAGFASMVGTTIEWYDFFLYGTAAALIFNKIFFPSFDSITGTLASFATYAAGFFARPLGGLVFGHFGDRVGRKSMLLITLFLMGVPSVLIGLIPSYDSIGYWAAILLVLMRILQGLALGGEWGGAVLTAVEHAPDRLKGLFGSLPQAGVAPGLILSSLAMTAVSSLPEQELLSWGWRVPFLAGSVLLLVGWVIRMKVGESPDFEAMRRKGGRVALPAKEVCLRYPRQVLAIIGARMAEVTWFYTIATFALAYTTGTLNIPRAAVLDATIVGAAVTLFSVPLFGALADKWGNRWVFCVAAASIPLIAPMFFSMLQTRDAGQVAWAEIIAMGLVYAALYGPEGSLFPALFPPEVRYSGISIAVQISSALGGGIAPIVATSLLARGHGDPRYIVWYLSALGVVGAISGALMRKAGFTADSFAPNPPALLSSEVKS